MFNWLIKLSSSVKMTNHNICNLCDLAHQRTCTILLLCNGPALAKYEFYLGPLKHVFTQSRQWIHAEYYITLLCANAN